MGSLYESRLNAPFARSARLLSAINSYLEYSALFKYAHKQALPTNLVRNGMDTRRVQPDFFEAVGGEHSNAEISQFVHYYFIFVDLNS